MDLIELLLLGLLAAGVWLWLDSLKAREAAVAAAKAACRAEQLLLLDEISEGLAPVIVQQLGEVIGDLKSKGFTIILVEQNFRFAAPLADRCW